LDLTAGIGVAGAGGLADAACACAAGTIVVGATGGDGFSAGRVGWIATGCGGGAGWAGRGLSAGVDCSGCCSGAALLWDGERELRGLFEERDDGDLLR